MRSLDNTFTIEIPITDQTVRFIEEAISQPTPLQGSGWGVACQAAEMTHVRLALPTLKAAIPAGKANLDVFTWATVLTVLAWYSLGKAKDNDDVVWAFWAIREVMHADPRYVALLDRVRDYERKQEKIERIKRRHERDARILNEYHYSCGDPHRALAAAN